MLVACFVVTIVSIWLVFAAIAYGTYATAWDTSELFAGAVVQLLEHDIAGDFGRHDTALAKLVAEAADADISALREPLRGKILFDASAPLRRGPIVLLDKNGRVELSSDPAIAIGRDMSGEPFFRAQRDGRVGTQPFVGDPQRSWRGEAPAITLSRPRIDAGGAFVGVAATGFEVADLTHLLDSVSLPAGSTIALVHRDGAILARIPAPPSGLVHAARAHILPGEIRKSAAGHYVTRSRLDGLERLVVYRQVGAFPVYLAVGLSTQDFIGKWRWRLVCAGAAFVGLTIVIVLLGIMLGRELRRRALAEQRLHQLAATDGLTGIANRRHFDEMLEREWRRAIRDVQPISLLMVDGDCFKSFNDTYGHVEGDKALCLIAEALKRSVERPGDLVARFGGEEFCVLLPGTDRDGAQAVAEAIRRAVTDLGVPHAGSPFGRLTVSIGVACRRPLLPETVSGLVEVADAALYLAKDQGRNRIVLDSCDLYPPKAA